MPFTGTVRAGGVGLESVIDEAHSAERVNFRVALQRGLPVVLWCEIPLRVSGGPVF